MQSIAEALRGLRPIADLRRVGADVARREEGVQQHRGLLGRGRSGQPLFAKWLDSCKYRPGEVEGSMMINLRKPAAFLVAAASVAGLLGPIAARAETIKAVMNSDLKIVDPIWTTAYVQRGFGYMVWDTLFALDDKLQVQPADGRQVGRLARQAHLDLHLARRPGVERRRSRSPSEDCIAVDQALGRPRFDGPEDAGLGRRASRRSTPGPSR